MSGHIGAARATYLLANNPNDLTAAGDRAKDPVGANVADSTNRYVIPLLATDALIAPAVLTINRILKALKGAGIIHFQ